MREDDDFEGEFPEDGDGTWADLALDPHTMLGATLGLAVHHGLTMEEIVDAWDVSSEPEYIVREDPMIGFDAAVEATCNLKMLVESYYSKKSEE